MSKAQVTLDWAKDTPCRNITIHGFCKFQDKGCMFKHESSPKTPAPTVLARPASAAVLTPPSSAAQLVSSAAALKKKFSADAPAFLPTTSANSSTTSFVKSPKVDAPLLQLTSEEKRFNIESPIFTPGGSNPYAPKPGTPVNPYAPASADMYFQAPTTYPLQYHLYAPAPPPHLQLPLQPYETNAHAMFIAGDLREHAQKRNAAILQVLPHSNLPEGVNAYHSLVPIDTHAERSARNFGHPSALYKVFSTTNGNVYALRRVEGVNVTSERAISDVQAWRSVVCANVVQFHEAFTSRAFGDNSVFFAYDYYPLATTLREAHVSPVAAKVVPITEALLWSYCVQLTNALTAIHEKNLAARVLDMDKVIITTRNRVRLAGCAVLDVLRYEEEDIATLQKQDIEKFGALMLELAAYTLPVTLRGVEALEGLAFSQEFKDCVRYLLSGSANLHEFTRMIAPRALAAVDSLACAADFMEGQLLSELENARLVRLLAKLGFINERPEYDNDPAWSETGDRYPLRLFRDYVFHQIDERSGRPVIDLSHVITCLNKLDAGVDEKILLVSNDEQSCIIASYKELHDLIDKTFRDLSRN
ncbi:hypothetical protein BABINDRAFT_7936 [Babjeviella inositovora NRRL Y-12698]|uniref:PAN2-PAN3 deadenylation complex subunit PAN3 n=1 Tax=Babjeviella inositovora NRRL Y-12698 TaxID=984486 RepID=A0A1E3QPW6_9ASCO|nr:uncharacterized protein BABINDRAFT_7936 [Babjeviella inositovora NRRL Y-12698]ODQ79725.1 hypothetical protein BABINDRAFT_7936 [Babjeviella inositovora NRRL Y-12698]